MEGRKQKFVRLEDKYYEVVITDKGLGLQPVDAMEYLRASVEKTVLGSEVPQFPEDDDNMMQKVIDEARKELEATLKNGIKETVLGVLGFEKDNWGRNTGFKVDHCNGRMSDITHLIAGQLKQQLIATQLNVDFILSPEERQELQENMRKDFANQYAQEVRSQTRSMANQLAHDDVKEYTRELLGSKKKEIADSVFDELMRSRPKLKSDTKKQ